MDLLSDLFRQAGLRRKLLDLRRLSDATALRFPCDKSIGLHLLVQGEVFIHADGLPAPLRLQAGDIAVMARGCCHVLSTQPVLDGIAVEPIGTGDGPQDGASSPAGAGTAAVISGAYQLWNTPVHPFFSQMPGWFVIRAETLSRFSALALAAGLLVEESQQRELGAESVLHGLLDVVFVHLLRRMVEDTGAAGAGWSHAVRDAQVRAALALMHGDCAHPWSLETLAQRAGLSRTALAERFREAMGDTPLNYLRTLRMQRAMSLLSETDATLEQVARQVGYQDAFGFSKVFKRTVGESPREFRRRDAAERSHPWRFQAGAQAGLQAG
ncbi:AraC family transcriptional regulator [Azohydromonas aeria]|uniref:AraC family transcriptional regulator n=1 Tax=Azohydromonas aeria TaxID=2590212 RepID=UPI0012FA1E5B|nr:AraC family transcriptional regulator [Azohydromonas aeria]